MSTYANLLGLTGLHFGILGLIIAVGFPDPMGAAALYGGVFVWLIGTFCLGFAYFDAGRPDRT